MMRSTSTPSSTRHTRTRSTPAAQPAPLRQPAIGQAPPIDDTGLSIRAVFRKHIAARAGAIFAALERAARTS